MARKAADSPGRGRGTSRVHSGQYRGYPGDCQAPQGHCGPIWVHLQLGCALTKCRPPMHSTTCSGTQGIAVSRQSHVESEYVDVLQAKMTPRRLDINQNRERRAPGLCTQLPSVVMHTALYRQAVRPCGRTLIHRQQTPGMADAHHPGVAVLQMQQLSYVMTALVTYTRPALLSGALDGTRLVCRRHRPDAR